MRLLRNRTLMLGTAFTLIMFVFVLRMMQMQIVDGAMYEAQISRGIEKTQEIKAARGEILDRYGRSLAVNQVSYNVVIDKAFFPTGRENEVLLRLAGIMAEQGESWIDNLPISSGAPYEFLEGREGDVARLKRFVNVNEYASADSVMHWLAEQFKLGEYTAAEARLLAGIRYEMLQKDFSYSNPFLFAEGVKITTATQIKERGFEVPGADIAHSAVRAYVNGSVAPHLLGRVGPIQSTAQLETLGEGYTLADRVGIGGLEGAFETDLHGTSGERLVSINTQGEVVQVIETKEPQPGNTIYTTIDMDIQLVAQQALEQQILWMQQHSPVGRGREAYAGATAAVDIQTGEILALANYPSYDINTYQQERETWTAESNSPEFDRALMGQYMPGSIFKPVVAMAGLHNGVIERDSTVYCGRVYTRFSVYQPTCLSAHQNFNVISALRESCNIFFYDVGYRTGLDEINRFARAMGLGISPGIELEYANAVTGSLTVKEEIEARGETFNQGDILQASIGQKENRFTPLQLANYAATIANRGRRMQLTLLKEVRTYDRNEVLRQHLPSVASEIEAADEVFDSVIDGLAECAQIGSGSYYAGYTGKTFGTYEVKVAAKTGTPQSTTQLNSMFIAFAPVENPQIAVAVVIENGWHGYTGAPVAREIFETYFAQLGRDFEREAQEAAESASQRREPDGESEDAASDTDTSSLPGQAMQPQQ